MQKKSEKYQFMAAKITKIRTMISECFLNYNHRSTNQVHRGNKKNQTSLLHQIGLVNQKTLSCGKARDCIITRQS